MQKDQWGYGDITAQAGAGERDFKALINGGGCGGLPFAAGHSQDGVGA
ncbi:hypothetical protein ES703_22877 [subsurface metagenome]